jgi:hypothetical protein
VCLSFGSTSSRLSGPRPQPLNPKPPTRYLYSEDSAALQHLFVFIRSDAEGIKGSQSDGRWTRQRQLVEDLASHRQSHLRRYTEPTEMIRQLTLELTGHLQADFPLSRDEGDAKLSG